MKFELKPLSFGEVLDGSFKILRGNLGLFLTIAFVFSGPTVLVSAWLRIAQQGVPPGKMPPGFGLAMLAITVISVFLWGAMTAAAVQVVTGQPADVGSALKRFLGILAPAFAASFLVVVIGSVCALALVIPGLIYFLHRALFLPVLLVEGGKATASMTRSKVLVRGKGKGNGRMGKLFGASLVFGVLTWVLVWGVGMLIPAGLRTTFLGACLSLLPQIVVAPLLPIAIVLIYFDVRIRDEGYDLELRAQDAAGAAAGAVPPAGPA